MNKTILAVIAAASVAMSAQAMAVNTAEVTVMGEVNDAATSCVIKPTGTLNNGIVRLTTITTSEANGQSEGALFKSQDFGFEVSDCAKGSTNAAKVNSLTVAVTGTTNSNPDILVNTADNGAQGIGIGITKKDDNSRLTFDGSKTMTETYKPDETSTLKYTAGYVKINKDTAVTEGPVKGVATFTIDYTVSN